MAEHKIAESRKGKTVVSMSKAHGHYVISSNTYCGADKANYLCSECGRMIMSAYDIRLDEHKNMELPKYCWNCGARLDGKTVTDTVAQ